MTGHKTYMSAMTIALRLLMIAVLALFAAGAHLGVAVLAAATLGGTAAGPGMMQMVDSEDCEAEEMQAGADHCGPTCASPAIGLAGAHAFQPASEPATGFPELTQADAGQSRRPDPNPPRFS